MRELMHRMGHGSMRAALVYQHATTERDRAIANALSDLVDAGSEDVDDGANDDEGPDDEDHAGVGRFAWWRGGAGDGNRTRVASLEDWGSTIELRPHGPPARAPLP